jgi:TPR repeat protein
VKDEVEAAGYLKHAADQNDASMQFHYALCFEAGRGVVKDEIEAARYYKLAADQKDSSSQNCYAISLGT